jgi:hypothetical protein
VENKRKEEEINEASEERKRKREKKTICLDKFIQIKTDCGRAFESTKDERSRGYTSKFSKFIEKNEESKK